MNYSVGELLLRMLAHIALWVIAMFFWLGVTDIARRFGATDGMIITFFISYSAVLLARSIMK